MTIDARLNETRALEGGAILRPIRISDDPAIARVIRTVMTDLGAVGKGFSIQDPEVDRMSAAYSGDKAMYFVIDQGGQVLGGAGVGPLPEADDDVCELKKMYMLRDGRGRGYGKALLDRCLEAARRLGYRRCYLETLTTMREARKLYEKNGFHRIDAPMGATGHFGCNVWYLCNVSPTSDLTPY